MFHKDRLISITDAIVAVAATIMVLKLEIPDQVSMDAFRHQRMVMLAYAISFVQIFLDWHEHHDTFLHADRLNHRVFFVNCLWLFSITLVPFVTGVVGRSPFHQASLLLYIAILFLEQMILIVLSRMTARLNGRPINDAGLIALTRGITIAAYAIGALSTFILPQATLVIVVAGCVINIVIIWVADGRKEKKRA